MGLGGHLSGVTILVGPPRLRELHSDCNFQGIETHFDLIIHFLAAFDLQLSPGGDCAMTAGLASCAFATNRVCKGAKNVCTNFSSCTFAYGPSS